MTKFTKEMLHSKMDEVHEEYIESLGAELDMVKLNSSEYNKLEKKVIGIFSNVKGQKADEEGNMNVQLDMEGIMGAYYEMSVKVVAKSLVDFEEEDVRKFTKEELEEIYKKVNEISGNKEEVLQSIQKFRAK
ncbi:hypothetical protein GLW05_20830 [Pontibacillus yanchengensis]|uniref:Uncharacterized protein n=1 Tax=Pontibacillus yanchengensis TaxID=462910 RepID=A0A6I5A772_9BACI|nr:hypothetical protein [Pontibacillus yanchengensis]MYL36019.1 hypothetical protein [Pontibacillus yanchengensis]